jgi:hypothetical protein
LISFKEYFKCGRIVSRSNISTIEFEVKKISNITEIIIPFFYYINYKVIKLRISMIFIKVADLMRIKAHLTSDGIDKIKNIQVGMNKGRYNI